MSVVWKKRIRHKRSELRARRLQVKHLRSQEYTAEEIYLGLKERFPDLTLEMVFDDIEVLKRHGPGYIEGEYLPEMGYKFELTEELLDSIIGEAMNIFHNGQTIEITKVFSTGLTIKETRVIQHPISALRLAGQAGVGKVNLMRSAPVAIKVKTLLAELQRLRNTVQITKLVEVPTAYHVSNLEHRPK